MSTFSVQYEYGKGSCGSCGGGLNSQVSLHGYCECGGIYTYVIMEVIVVTVLSGLNSQVLP